MWKACFPNSTIHGLDLYNKSALEEDRIRIYKGSQFDRDSLLDTYRKMGSVDIVIDDGSHFSEHVIFSFKVLFPLLSENGIYVIEDTQTSYWKFAGGDSEDLRNPSTLMNFFKDLADGLNYQEVPARGTSRPYSTRRSSACIFITTSYSFRKAVTTSAATRRILSRALRPSRCNSCARVDVSARTRRAPLAD